MKRSKVARFMGLAVAVAMTMAVMPVTASADDLPFENVMSGELPELSEKVSYPFKVEGEENTDTLNVTMNYVTDNSTVILSKSPSFEGRIEWYGYIYLLDNDNNVIDYTGQIAQGMDIAEKPVQIDVSSKEFGAGYAGNLKNAVYYLNIDCIPTNGESKNWTLSYRIYDDGKSSDIVKMASNTELPVLVDTENIMFEAYDIDNNNYISLRDFAMAVNGTPKQFEVGFDSAKNAITLTSNKAYTATGKELPINVEAIRREEEKKKYFEETGIRSDVNTALIDRVTKNAMPTDSKVYVDGKEVSLTAYNIGGSNYFKLRDIAKLFDIGVTYDNATSTVGIDTSISYTE